MSAVIKSAIERSFSQIATILFVHHAAAGLSLSLSLSLSSAAIVLVGGRAVKAAFAVVSQAKSTETFVALRCAAARQGQE